MMPNYIRIEILRMLRNKRYIIFVVAFPVGFYLLYSNICGGRRSTDSGRGERQRHPAWSPWPPTARWRAS